MVILSVNEIFGYIIRQMPKIILSRNPVIKASIYSIPKKGDMVLWFYYIQRCTVKSFFQGCQLYQRKYSFANNSQVHTRNTYSEILLAYNEIEAALLRQPLF